MLCHFFHLMYLTFILFKFTYSCIITHMLTPLIFLVASINITYIIDSSLYIISKYINLFSLFYVLLYLHIQ
ncbi:hypothetical protein CNEO2_160004 [Clostridium neonatale]|nr:hypothetical protein CNEO2_160004 [Clostridium neonatale]